MASTSHPQRGVIAGASTSSNPFTGSRYPDPVALRSVSSRRGNSFLPDVTTRERRTIKKERGRDGGVSNATRVLECLTMPRHPPSTLASVVPENKMRKLTPTAPQPPPKTPCCSTTPSTPEIMQCLPHPLPSEKNKDPFQPLLLEATFPSPTSPLAFSL